MTCCRPDPNSVGMPPLEPAKTIVECGTWVGSCGKGIHEFFLYLGRINSKVTVWFERKYADDVLNAYQFGEILGATPTGGKEGSFSFEYAPYDQTKAGADEIKIEIINNHRDSEWKFRVDCPEEYKDDPPIAEIKETESECGRYHHQAGYAKKNTILLGDEPGNVNVTWAIQGYAEVKFYQGDTLLKTIRSNRSDTFSFWYDPTKGPVYALTQGTGTVDYLFSCPYIPPEEIPEKFEFTCGDDIHVFQAAKTVDVILPTDESGNVEIWFETEVTVVLKFYQRETLLYQVQQLEGAASFSFDYDPANGPLKIIAENYGQFRVSVKCPYDPPVIPPDPPKLYDLDCWDELQTFESPSEITARMPNVAGSVLVTYVIPGNTELSINQAGMEIGHGYPQDGLRSFQFDYQPVKGDLLIVANGDDDFQLWVDCPIPPPPPEHDVNCGTENTFASPNVTNISFPDDLSGNFVLNSNLPVAVYKNNQLVANVTGSRNFFFTIGDKWKVVSTESGSLTLSTTCPSLKLLECGPDPVTFLAGDTILVDLDEKTGDTKPVVTAPDTVTIVWYVDGALFKSTTGNATFDLYLPELVEVKLISLGTGSFDVTFPCPVARTPEGSCGKLVHEGTGAQADRPIRISGDGSVLISYEVGANQSLTFSTSAGEIDKITGPVAPGQFVYTYLETEGPIVVSFGGTGDFKFVINCPPGPGEDLVVSPPDLVLDGKDVEDDPDQEEIECDDSYNTQLDFVSDLTLPVPSAGTECALNLQSRAFSHPGMVSSLVYGATLMTAVRDIQSNNMKTTKIGNDFFFYYEFPVALEAEDYTFVLKASEPDCDVAMYLNCYPVLDRARNRLLRETVTLFDPQSFVQIYWRYPDDITSQKQMTGGIYAAIVRTATNEVVWRSGDIMQKVRTSAKLVCEDKPRWPILVEPKSEQVPCPSGQTKEGVVGGVPYLIATWEKITWSDGVVEETEKELDGVCKVPPTEVSRRTVNVSRQCPSGQTVGGVWQGTATQTGSYVEITWSNGTKTNSETVWESFCAVPEKPAATIVSRTPKTSVDPCPSGETKGGYIGGDSFIIGDYFEILWSDGTKTYTEKTYAATEYCALPTRPKEPPTIVSQQAKSASQPCPSGQTIGGIPGGRTAITGSYIEYSWSDGTKTQSPVTWEEGAVCQVIVNTPENINPRILGPVYVGKPSSAAQGAVGAGTVITPSVPTPYGSLNPVNAATYAAGMDDQYGAKRIVFSANKNTKPVAKDFYVSVPISLPISAETTTIYRVEVMASGVGVSAPMLLRQTAFAISKQNGRCSVMEIVPQGTSVTQPDRVQSNPASGMTAYDFAINNKGGVPISTYQVPANNPNACPLNKVNYSNDYAASSLLFKVDTRQAGSGLAGFSFVVLNSVTGAVLYRSGQDGNIRVTS